METINNILQYQYPGNSAVIYALLHASQHVDDLKKLEFVEQREALYSSRVQFMEWKGQLQYSNLLALLDYFEPLIDLLPEPRTEIQVKELLQRSTLVGLLPAPHPLLSRTYTANAGGDRWLTHHLWGVVYMSNQTFPLWDSREILLFKVSSSLA